MRLLSNWVNRTLVNSNFQLNVESLYLRFQLWFEISNESTKFPVNLQNSVSLMMSGTQERSFGPDSEKLV